MNLKMKKAGTLCIAWVLLMAFMLTGCGKSVDHNTGAETAAPSSAPEVSEPEATEAASGDQQDASEMSLKDAYADYFQIGVAISSWQLQDKDTLAAVTKDFSSCTAENEMKPENVLDYDASVAAKDKMPEIKTDNIDNIMKPASEAGLKMRGHTLVWHSQTPDWLFYEDYDTNKGYVDKDTMLKRMEAYIKKVLTYCQETYPGVIYAWDVVNEAFSDDAEGGYRLDSPWYEIIGEEYVEKAFEYARKYADPDVKLFLNDYNCTSASKRDSLYAAAEPLAKKGILDGIGMQSHHDMKYFSVNDVQNALFKFAQIPDIEIQLTELDLHNPDNSEEGLSAQAESYGDLFKMILNMKKDNMANITSVTFWGLSDATTWLTGNKGEKSYPLLFDEDMNAKPCYYTIYNAAKE